MANRLDNRIKRLEELSKQEELPVVNIHLVNVAFDDKDLERVALEKYKRDHEVTEDDIIIYLVERRNELRSHA